jgi:hypothetical protein
MKKTTVFVLGVALATSIAFGGMKSRPAHTQNIGVCAAFVAGGSVQDAADAAGVGVAVGGVIGAVAGGLAGAAAGGVGALPGALGGAAIGAAVGGF